MPDDDPDVERGPVYRWFAWHPVNTEDRGWRWLRPLNRRRVTIYRDGYRAGRYFTHSVKGK